MPNRRHFLRRSASVLGAASVAPPLWNLLDGVAEAGSRRESVGYGKPMPVQDETTGLPLLNLPEGFRYASFGWTNDPMTDGQPTPSAHDGMAVVGEREGRLQIVRNHEVNGFGKPMGTASASYDARGRAGCTVLEFDAAKGEWLGSRVGLSGTVRNCAGGPTPWGTWLSCEETVVSPGDALKGVLQDYEETHGWIFEVATEGESKKPVPLKAMGRFVHEAVAVDPKSGIVYETEDRGTSGFYRFLPTKPGQLTAGGRLQMLKVEDQPDLRRTAKNGDEFDVSWVDIEDPERAHSPDTDDALGVFRQGKQRGGTTFARLEGCWFADGVCYFTATSGGKAGRGQVWAYVPKTETLTLVYESPEAKVLDYPDNLTVRPGGAIFVCEDGKWNPQRLHGLTRDGRLFPFAENQVVLRGQRNDFRGDYRGKEWAGVCFSPDGEWMFVNVQTPGITFAITGPWGDVA